MALGALRRLWAKTRGIVRRRDDGGGAPKKGGDSRRPENAGYCRQLATFGIAMAAALAVFVGLTLCDLGMARVLAPFGLSCARGSQIADNLSTGAGAGFLVFLIAEVTTMVFAELFRQRRLDAEERRAEIAELAHKMEVAELARRREAAESRAEISELSRRVEAAERRAEAAERRAEVAELSHRAEIAELGLRAEAAERKAEAERAARLELELKMARNGAKNGEGDGG